MSDKDLQANSNSLNPEDISKQEFSLIVVKVHRLHMI